MQKFNFVFFGGEPLAVPVLEILYESGFIPGLVVSNPDRPQGRKMQITPPPVKTWAEKKNIPVFQPHSLKTEESAQTLKNQGADLFIVVSYSKILPKEILEIPRHGVINIHPSILPLYRGPAPIIAPILNGDTETGVTIIKIDEEMDHGPVLAQEKIDLTGNEFIQDLEQRLAELGGNLLVKILPEYVSGKIKPVEQNHAHATYVKKVVKTDGLIDLRHGGDENYRKFRAYAKWPRTFFLENDKRMIITDAALEDGKFIIKKIIPEGGKETEYKN